MICGKTGEPLDREGEKDRNKAEGYLLTGKVSMWMKEGRRLCTGFLPVISQRMWRSIVLPRGPGKMTAREEVEGKVEHGLAGAAAVIDDHPVAFGIEPFFRGYFFRGQEKMPDEVFIGFGHAVDIGDVLPGDHEGVDGRLGTDVLEGGNKRVLINDF